MSKIECLFTIFPVLILMYATFYFMPYFVGKKHIYGVSIDQEHKNYNYFIKLIKYNFKPNAAFKWRIK